MLIAPFIRKIRTKRALIVLGSIGAVLGDLPDLIGEYGYLFQHGNGHLRFDSHYGVIRDYLIYIPMCALHYWLDSYTTKMLTRWTVWNQWVEFEVMLWTINLIFIAVLIMIWRRVQDRRRAEARFHFSIDR